MAEEAELQAGVQTENNTPEKDEARRPTNAELLAQSQAAAAKSEADKVGLPGKLPADKPAGGSEGSDAAQSLDASNLANTGNAMLDASITMMQQTAGLNSEDVDRILSNAFARGDASLIDTAYIKERFGDKAGYVEQLANAYIQHTTEQTQATVNSVYELAGGEEGWNLHNQTFQQHAPAHLQSAAKSLADAGNFKEAATLIVEYSKGTGLVPVSGTHIRGGGAVANGALTAEGFRTEMNKLRESTGNRSLESGPAKAQYDALVRRRQAGRMQNL